MPGSSPIDDALARVRAGSAAGLRAAAAGALTAGLRAVDHLDDPAAPDPAPRVVRLPATRRGLLVAIALLEIRDIRPEPLLVAVVGPPGEPWLEDALAARADVATVPRTPAPDRSTTLPPSPVDALDDPTVPLRTLLDLGATLRRSWRHHAAHAFGRLALDRLDRAGVPPDDPRRGEARLLVVSSDVWTAPGDPASLAAADALFAEVEAHGWTDVLPEALFVLGQACIDHHRFDRARALNERAIALARADGDAARLAVCLRQRGAAALRFSDLPRATRLLEEADAAAVDAAPPDRFVARVGLAYARFRLGQLADADALLGSAFAMDVPRAPGTEAAARILRGQIAIAANDAPRARVELDRAAAIATAHRQRQRVSTAITALAELDREAGDLDAAIAGYRRAIRVDPRENLAARLTLVLCHVAREDWDAAARAQADAAAHVGDRPTLRDLHTTLGLPIVLHRGHDPAPALAAAERLRAAGFTAADLGATLVLAADAAEDAALAARCLGLALHQWTSVGRDADAAAARARLQALGEAGTPVPLGAFALHGSLGRGAMGEVWGAEHRSTGTPVAVKVMTREAWRSRTGLAAFEREVRATAGLRHPNVAVVLDHGRVDAAADAMTAGRLPAGSPYLVMERLPGDTLAARAPTDWPGVRDALLRILAALAHAHARGVVHRDLKPGNVLVSADPERRWVLADFGLAWTADGTATQIAGTPAYMAPEQWTVRSDRFGPGTDLYALGCVAWELLTGSPPFGSGSMVEMAAAHLGSPVPPLPRDDLPPGLERWLHRLLAKDPDDRFPLAADAAAALQAVAATPVPAAGPRPSVASTWSFEVDGSVFGAAPAPARTPGRGEIRTPGDWTAPVVDPPRLRGASLRLFGLREHPIVGRGPVQAALWAALVTAVAEDAPRAVVLRGPAGVGRSRLLRWLARRAHEQGVARPVPLVGAVQPPGPTDRCALVTVDDVVDPEAAARAVVGLLRGSERALVVVLALRDDQGPVPAALTAEPVVHVRVPPLGRQDHRTLVEDLGLERAAAAEVARRTDGHPAHATALVADWLARDVLTVGEDRLVLAADADRAAPADLRHALVDRVRTVVGDRGLHGAERLAVGAPVAAEVAERLAAAGLARRVDGRIVPAHDLLREALVAHAGAAGRLDDHHRAAAAALAGTSDPADRVRLGRHLAATGDRAAAAPLLLDGARALYERGDWDAALDAARAADHTLLASGSDDDRRGWARVWIARSLWRVGRLADATDAGVAVRDLAADRGWPTVRGWACLVLARIAITRRHIAAAVEPASAAARAAEALGDDRLAAEAAIAEGLWRASRGDPTGIDHIRRGTAGFTALGDRRNVARGQYQIGLCLRQRGAFADASASYRRAAEGFAVLGDRNGAAACQLGMGELARRLGDPIAARRHFGSAAEGYAAAGTRGVLFAAIQLSTLDIEEGALAEARRRLDAALPRLRREGRPGSRAVARILRVCAAATDPDAPWTAWVAAARAAVRDTVGAFGLGETVRAGARHTREAGWAARADDLLPLADALDALGDRWTPKTAAAAVGRSEGVGEGTGRKGEEDA